MRDWGVYNLKKALPRMSWEPINLYNLRVRSSVRKTSFTSESSSLFQQRWVCKAMSRAYHGDYIPEKIFKRWYLPATLPDVRPKRKTIGDDRTELELFAQRKIREDQLRAEEEEKGIAPVGSLMFAEVERRIDVFVFRCCFAPSVYEARRLVIHGKVMLNGKKHQNANTRLAPGDMVHVDPGAINFLKPKTESPAAEPSTSEGESDDELAASPPNLRDDVPSALAEELQDLTPCHLPPYSAPWLFIPAYIEVSFTTCTGIYVRHPTARPGYSEIPTPYDADGDVMRFTWEWYAKVRPRIRSQSQLARMPEDRALALLEDDGLKHGRRKRR